MKRYAFTLAEILITLSILGIVAAITIPNVIKNYKRKVTVTKVKKMYANLSSAYELYLLNNNNEAEIFYDTKEDSTRAYEKIIKPYFSIKKDAGTGATGRNRVLGTQYYYTDEKSGRYDWASDGLSYAVELKDGSVLWTKGYVSKEKYLEGTSTKLLIGYDINGKEKPNAYGKDTFFFFVIRREIVPGRDCSTPRDIQACAKNCIKSTSGSTCSAWIIAKGNMNYLDCPSTLSWETGKCN